MDFSRANKINIKEEALDLRTYEAHSRESEDRSKLSEKENPKVRQAKRRREYETYYNSEVKKLKRDKIITVKQEMPENEVNQPNVQYLRHSQQGLGVKIPMVQIPYDPLRNLVSGIVDIPDKMIIPVPFIKKEPEFKDSSTVMSTSASRNLSIKQEPVDELDTTSSSQPTLVPAHVHPFSGDVIIKQESTDQENISPNLSNGDDDYVSSAMETANLEIGPHGTCISRKNLESINWMEPSIATRKLLSLLFDNQTLATHTLSGKPSPAFRDRPLKAQLDPLKVADVIYFVKQRANCSDKVIRLAITSKCADTAKIVRRNLSKTK